MPRVAPFFIEDWYLLHILREKDIRVPAVFLLVNFVYWDLLSTPLSSCPQKRRADGTVGKKNNFLFSAEVCRFVNSFRC